MPSVNPTVTPDYNFIVNPTVAKKTGPKLPSTGSMIGRTAIVLILILVVLMAFVVIKSLVSKPSSATGLVSIAQDQQAIVHVATAAATQTGISTTTLNSAVTAQASVASDQAALLDYLGKHSVKVKTAELSARVSAATDTQLTNAVSAGIYDSTYKSVMQNLLNVYSADLSKAYTQTTGTIAKGLLKNDYNSAQLLIKQLN
jgi:hypothetical protein